MKETVEAFLARTGLRYEPAEELLGWGRPLAGDEACPTLFRYPGPCGVRDVLDGRLDLLGAPGSSVVWLSASPIPPEAPSAARFGTLAVLQPLRLRPVVSDEPGVYVARNGPCGGAVLWVPPGAFGLDWDRVGTCEEALAALGDPEPARAAVRAELEAYQDEVRRLHEAGGEHPRVKWAEVPAPERRRLLRALGVEPVWSEAA